MNNYATKRNFERVNPRSDVFSFQNLLKSYYQCRKRKRKTINAARFEINFEKRLLELEQDLKNHTWRPLPSNAFVVTEPKIREIFAADFRDRIVHHLLYNYLVSVWEPKFIFDSYACRKGKGTHKASVVRLRQFLKKITANNREGAFCLQADVKSFFTSINHNILFSLIQKHTKDLDILWLAKTIIFHDPTKNPIKRGQLSLFDQVPPDKSLFHIPKNQGLPIGNITSQFFANVYLNELDQFAKHQLKAKYYIRYVDDFIILHQDPEILDKWRRQTDCFLQQELALKLHPKKQKIYPIKQGIDFLGYIIKPTHILNRKRVVKSLKNKLWRFNKKILNLNLEHPIRLWTPELCDDFKEIFACVNSYYGMFKHADSYRLREHLYKKHFGILKTYLISADKKYSYFIWDE
jgi:RNA-directed DNA polymerase